MNSAMFKWVKETPDHAEILKSTLLEFLCGYDNQQMEVLLKNPHYLRLSVYKNTNCYYFIILGGNGFGHKFSNMFYDVNFLHDSVSTGVYFQKTYQHKLKDVFGEDELIQLITMATL